MVEMHDGIDDVYEGEPEITMTGNKIFFGDWHVATLEEGLPCQIEEQFVRELLNGAKSMGIAGHLQGYLIAVDDVSKFKSPAINYLKDFLGSKVAAFILPRSK